MSRKRIIASDDSAVILRWLEEAVRAQKLAESTDAVLERRQSAYERLAEGVE